MHILLNIIGIILVLALLFLASYDRKAINWKLILKALLAQFVIAVLIIKVPAGRAVISKVSDAVSKILNYGSDGLQFVFGSLGLASGPSGFVFAFQVLGNIVFISAVVAVLFYLGILGFIVSNLGRLIGKLFKTSEVESFVAVANMFLGQTDSPILVSKYIKRMTDSEIMLVLVSGMGSMSVSIMSGYVSLGIPMEALLIASTMVPLGSIICSKILFPQTETIQQIKDVKMDRRGNNENVLDALSAGAMEGMHMAMAVGAALIAIIAIVAMINGGLSYFNLSLEGIFSYVFSPIGYLMGLDGNLAMKAGELLGSKLILNEFVAFANLAPLLSSMDARTGLILCISIAGFANVSSIGICISGIAILCPEKRSNLARLAVRGMFGGFAVSLLSALIVGLLMLF